MTDKLKSFKLVISERDIGWTQIDVCYRDVSASVLIDRTIQDNNLLNDYIASTLVCHLAGHLEDEIKKKLKSDDYEYIPLGDRVFF